MDGDFQFSFGSNGEGNGQFNGHQAEGDKLYSMKWYHSSQKLYRYLTTYSPKTIVFNGGDGVTVDSASSTAAERDRYPRPVVVSFERYVRISDPVSCI